MRVSWFEHWELLRRLYQKLFSIQIKPIPFLTISLGAVVWDVRTKIVI